MAIQDGRAGRDDEDIDEQAVEASARAGFAARAVLYGIVGLLAAQLALGGAGEDASQQGAMSTLAQQPFGSVLLGALALGLVAYAVFRAVEAVKGHGQGGVVKRRVIPVVRAVVNLGLAALALRTLLGSSGGDTESGVTAAVLEMPAGQLLVGAVGLIVVAVGVKQLVSAWTGDVNELASPADLPAGARRTARTVGRLGHLGRGVAFVVVGGFVVRAAITHDSESGVGLDAALGEVVQAPFGTPLLLGVAVCLFLFGVHCAVEAWYGETDVGD